MPVTAKKELVNKLETIERLNPKRYSAIAVMVEWVHQQEIERTHTERGASGRLLARLQNRHDCHREDSGRFEALEPLGGVRRWECQGCGAVVELENEL
jgi:hypothetical protein